MPGYLAYSCPIRHPDVLHLGGAAKEVVAFELLLVAEIEIEAARRPGLLEVADTGLLDHSRGCGVAGEPEGIDAVVFGEGLGEGRRDAGDDVDDARRNIGG